MSKSIQGIIYARDRVSINYGIVVAAFVVYKNSQLPSFLADKQDGVTILRFTELYPAFLEVFLQVFLHFLKFSFTYSLQPVMRNRRCRV